MINQLILEDLCEATIMTTALTLLSTKVLSHFAFGNEMPVLGPWHPGIQLSSLHLDFSNQKIHP